VYADTSDSQARHELDLGRVEEAARLEQEVYEIAEKVLAQRPADLRSMANRALAAGFLGDLAARRHDYATAVEFAAKAEQAGEDYVRFNPADLGSWVYWVRGRDVVVEAQAEQGRVLESLAKHRSIVALEKDPRAPPNLPVLLNFTWFELAVSEARVGQPDAAEKSLREAIRANDTLIAKEGKDSPRGLLLRVVPDGVRARLQLYAGGDRRAFESAGGVITSLGQVAIPEDNANSVAFRQNLRRFSLTTQSIAAIRMRQYAEAEALSRARLDLPNNPFTNADPEDETSRAKVMLAHAIAEQGRGVEAFGLVESVLARYRNARSRGADGVSFRRDLAHALFVSAISQPADAAGRGRRTAALAEASALIGGLSAEAQRLADVRMVTQLIAAARSGSVGGST
jgi:tetratricopeptide (TPR) repeat protein